MKNKSTAIKPTAFFTNQSARMLINGTTGNVGIGTASPGAKLEVIGNIRASGCVNGSAGTVTGGGTCVDIAELYPAEKGLEAGDIVCMKNGKAGICSSAFATSVLGVISTKPAIVIEGENVVLMGKENYTFADDKAPIALKGRIPVKVDCDAHPVKEGDLLVSSKEKGYAQSIKSFKGKEANDILDIFGSEFGKALENCRSGKKMILAWVG